MGITVRRSSARRLSRRRLLRQRRLAGRSARGSAWRSIASALSGTRAMTSSSPALVIDEIERRHDEVIAELESLNGRIEAVLRDVMATRGAQDAANADSM